MGDDGGRVEVEIEDLIRRGQFDPAATRLLEIYGPELVGFLVHAMRNEADAAEVFSQTVEDLWKGLPKFAFRCSLRTWLYVLGRHALARYRRSPWQRRGGESRIQSLADLVRTRTQPWLRTDVKDRFHSLREALDEDDRTLLVLRVDRELPWEDIARVMLGDDASDDDTVAREAARLRKRFQLLKGDLRRRAREAGLLDDDQ
jgi:RNA polymerase sigma-70 factor (ECF subfamily)